MVVVLLLLLLLYTHHYHHHHHDSKALWSLLRAGIISSNTGRSQAGIGDKCRGAVYINTLALGGSWRERESHVCLTGEATARQPRLTAKWTVSPVVPGLTLFQAKPEIQISMKSYALSARRSEQAAEASLCFFTWVSRSTLNSQATTWFGWVPFISTIGDSQAPGQASIE